MQPRDHAYLLDILTAAQRILEVSMEVTPSDLQANWRIQDVLIRELEVIGEATKRISEELRTSHQEIPWHDMAALRDRLIHGYDSINFDIVWDTVRRDIPELILKLSPIIPSGENAGNDHDT